MVAMAFLGGTLLWNLRKGYAWYNSMPAGYELSLVGCAIVFFGGIGDMIWHTLFGIEKNIDGLFSPTHISIVIGLALIVSGPYRAAWQRNTKAPGLVAALPMLISLTSLLSTLTLISLAYHPVIGIVANRNTDADQTIGAISIVTQTILLEGLLLLTLRRWSLPFGALTLLLTVNVVLLRVVKDHYFLIPAMALAGLVCDVILWRLKPSIEHADSLRLFAFIMPVVIYLLYFLTIQVTMGVAWTIHLWLGTTFVAGVVGWLLSYILIPPAVPISTPKKEG